MFDSFSARIVPRQNTASYQQHDLPTCGIDILHVKQPPNGMQRKLRSQRVREHGGLALIGCQDLFRDAAFRVPHTLASREYARPV